MFQPLIFQGVLGKTMVSSGEIDDFLGPRDVMSSTNFPFFHSHGRRTGKFTYMGVSKNRETPQNGWWK